MVFASEDRERLRAELVAAARADPAVAGAALTGSAALGREDRWSDIDLALCAAPVAGTDALAAGWTERMYREHGAVDHLDVRRGGVLYRVFLLADTLQVDLSFWAVDGFGATGPAFSLLFGEAVERPHTPAPQAGELIGTAWLYALHARSGIARGRAWSAEYALAGMRDAVLSLACLRHGTNPVQGRGRDDLPPQVARAAASMLVTSLDEPELRRAFRAATGTLLDEAGLADPPRAARLGGPLRELLR